MKKNILEADFILEMRKICDLMYHKGWNERNGGNISYILDPQIIAEYLDKDTSGRSFPLESTRPNLGGMYFLITGTGKYFKNIFNNPEDNLGIIKIADDGASYEIIWGLAEAKPTSEISAHLLSHEVRLSQDPEHRVVIHNHATNIEAMTFVEDLTDQAFSKILWQMQTESIVVFPEGVGVLPWMVCGSDLIGTATAEKMAKYRLVIWAHHGIFGAGKNIDEAFGLIETAEKAAEIYMKIAGLKIKQTITDHELIKLAETFKVDYNQEFLK